jgi:DNA polymerase
VIIDADSSQIEARIVAWVSGQADLVDFFEKNNAEILAGVPKEEMQYDPYKIMASQIYGKEVDQITAPERFVGKTTILGAGYGMGAVKFQAQLKTFGVDMPLEECQRIITIYRQTYAKIPALWKQGQACLEAIVANNAAPFGVVGVPQFDASEKGFLLPSGLWQRYNGLRKTTDAEGKAQFVYQTRKGWTKLYGGKLVENICQALARCVIAEQMLKIGKKYRPVLTVHDAVACIAPIEEKDEASVYMETCMRWRPDWCTDLPLNCEWGSGVNYGEC